VNELLFLLSMREFCSYRFILLWIFLTIALFCPDYSARARVRYFLTSNFFFADVSYLMFCMFLNEFCRCGRSRGRLRVKEGDVAWSMTTLCDTSGM
jgi:hypothetical protein